MRVTAAHPGTGPICSVSEALTTVAQPRADASEDDTTLGFKGSPDPVPRQGYKQSSASS